MKNHAKTKGIHMKTTSLIHGKTVAVASAVAVSAALAIGMVGCAPNDESPSDNSTATSNAIQTEDETEDGEASYDNIPAESQEIAGIAMSPKDALAIALKRAGLKESQVQVIKNELDTERGIPCYEIEFIGPDNMEYEAEINTTNEDIMSFEVESLYD